MSIYICKSCSSYIKERPSHPRKYCSQKCYNIARPATKHICKYCKIDFLARRKVRLFCSVDCQRKSFIGNGPNKGNTISEETRKLHKARRRTKEQKELASKQMTEKYLKGWMPQTKCKRGHFLSHKNNKTFYFRSSYELAAYEILEIDDNVKSYEVEAFAIPYFWRGITRHYVPDIRVLRIDGSIEIIEVKASWQLSDDRVIHKMQAAQIYCLEHGFIYSVWTEKDIV